MLRYLENRWVWRPGQCLWRCFKFSDASLNKMKGGSDLQQAMATLTATREAGTLGISRTLHCNWLKHRHLFINTCILSLISAFSYPTFCVFWKNSYWTVFLFWCNAVFTTDLLIQIHFPWSRQLFLHSPNMMSSDVESLSRSFDIK